MTLQEERKLRKTLMKQPSCRNCAHFRVMDPDVFSIIAKGLCKSPDDRTPINSAAVECCWLHQPETFTDRVKKAADKIAGHFRAFKRRHTPRKDTRPLPVPVTILADEVKIQGRNLWLEYLTDQANGGNVDMICAALRKAGFYVSVAEWHRDGQHTYDVSLDTLDYAYAQRCLKALCGFKE